MAHHQSQVTVEGVSTASPFERLVVTRAYRTLIVIRVSTASLDALLSQTALGRRLHAQLPAMQAFLDMPDAVLQNSAEGKRLREQHGFVEITRRDASIHAASPGKVIGYAASVGDDGLLLFVHDSAGATNVQVPGDALPRNAFSELLVGLFEKGRNPPRRALQRLEAHDP